MRTIKDVCSELRKKTDLLSHYKSEQYKVVCKLCDEILAIHKASVGKVVEQLEEAMNDANMRSGDYEDYDDYEQGRATAFNESIDIVKQNLTD